MLTTLTLGWVVALSSATISGADGEPSTAADTPTESAAITQSRTTRITIGPVMLLLAQVPMEYERAVNDGVSVVLGVTPTLPIPPIVRLANSPLIGLTGSAGCRFFPMSAPAPGGIWLGPQVRLTFSAFPNADGGAYESTAATLAMVGYTFIGSLGLTASVGAGAGLSYLLLSRSNASKLSPATALHLNIGYAF